MSDSTTRAYRLWAIVSSAVCLGLIAYIVASHTTAPEVEQAAKGPRALEPEFAAPAWLVDLPSEWMSSDLGTDARGHAVMLDIATSGELIVERCHHRGYFDIARELPRESDWSFCETVLRGAVEDAGGDRLRIRRPDGTVETFVFELAGEPGPQRLSLVLDEGRLELVPGSRNDLYQRMEELPSIRAERDAMLGTPEQHAR